MAIVSADGPRRGTLAFFQRTLDRMSTSTPRTALICGISGQDGAYLAQHLLDRGYRVVGTSRDAQMSGFGNLVRLGLRGRVELASMAVNDFRSVLQVLARFQPDEIYN